MRLIAMPSANSS
uniref:Uncharacterized protein n=1 Tax=Rhizophora mucronata TaxID=61149 RepID=A0A2P2QUE1_RHIMU